MNFVKKLICIIQIKIFFLFSQNYIPSNNLTLAKNRILMDIALFSKNQNNNISKKYKNQIVNNFNISFNFNYAFNNGHSNIDNNSIFFAPAKFNQMRSVRLEYNNSWLNFEIEPYKIFRNSLFNGYYQNNSFNFLNNNTNGNNQLESEPSGLKNSRFIVHYKGFGFGYGIENHWWGEGFHSSISLTSNSSSQETYSMGTFKEIFIGKFSFYSKFILMPYKNYENEQIYFSGMKLKVSYLTNPIISIGLNRFYLSGNFQNLYDLSSLSKPWSKIDAFGLLFEPLFGQDKKNLDYTIPNTPGFDIWDETLAANIKLLFPNDHLEVYVEIVSDDSRANLVDLTSHWDHTLGYTIGLKKFTFIKEVSMLFALEYLSTKPSNTFKKEFYRGDGFEINYFTRYMYNHFTYQTRFMGPHSGSSSDDLIFLIGFKKDQNSLLLSYNIERHGLKSFQNPQFKKELSITYKYEISSKNELFLNYEYETIQNFGFELNTFSKSNLIWFGYTHYFLRK